MDPNCPTFNVFFETENALSEETAKTCEGGMWIHECEIALKSMETAITTGKTQVPVCSPKLSCVGQG